MQVEHLIDGIEYRGIGRGGLALVDLIGVFHSVVALGYHIHLHKSASNGIALTYHAAKEAVTAKSGISRNEQIA